jgi:hypothetical protein
VELVNNTNLEELREFGKHNVPFVGIGAMIRIGVMADNDLKFGVQIPDGLKATK